MVCHKHIEHSKYCDDCLMVRKYILSLKTTENWRRMDVIGSWFFMQKLPPWRIDRFGTPIISEEN